MNVKNTNRSVIIILAAGSSSRMGRPKQLLPWGDATLLQNAVNTARASVFDEVLVVLGSLSDIIEKTLPPNITTLNNEKWKEGMGSSIACGVQFLQNQREKPGAILIMLGDQPFISTRYLNSLHAHFMKAARGIVATSYNGRAGVPALFGKKYFDELGKLNTEFGAKELLANSAADIHLVEAGDCIADIDTEADYHNFNKQSK